MNNTLTQAHTDTTVQNIHETARQLNSHLGPTAVSYLAGAKTKQIAVRWAQAEGPEPRQEARHRLLAAHRIWQMLSTSENDYVARNWFIGSNPRLEELSPLEALREGQVKQTLEAAKAFWDGTDG